MNFFKPLSYLGSPIHKTEEARANDARGFFRVASALGLGRRSTLVKFARYIRFGFLSVRDAQDLLLGRLESKKVARYSLAKYWISSGYETEYWFYFNPKQLWHAEEDAEKVVENTTQYFAPDGRTRR